MAEFGKPGEPETLIPKISQETLAEMIGTTRSRVSFFMNRFRKLGFVEYNGRIRVHKSLLNVILHDQLPDDNAVRPEIPMRPGVDQERPKSSELFKTDQQRKLSNEILTSTPRILPTGVSYERQSKLQS